MAVSTTCWNERGHLSWMLCYLDLHLSFMVILEATRGFHCHSLRSLVIVTSMPTTQAGIVMFLLNQKGMGWKDVIQSKVVCPLEKLLNKFIWHRYQL
ncbi:hypothetical protein CsSME_00047055 [Camellia sinensis var. sinensis]